MNAQLILKACASPLAEPTPAKLLDRVREACRVRHYSRRTEEARKGLPGRKEVVYRKNIP